MNQDNDDIAVIGIGCRFPEANSSDRLFSNLLQNKDSIQEIPIERWNAEHFYNNDSEKNMITSKWGGFISGVNEFDSRFFKIIPSEADLIDPQQKLFLTCSWEALEDAGYAMKSKVAGKPIGVYAGVTWNEFSLIANEYGYLQDSYKGAGALYWGIPNRVSYFFDFKGPSIAIDTACSSSLVAVHLAAQSLRSGECQMALAGGVNLSLHPAKYQFLSNSNFLSSEGKCRGFGEGGDGYVPSEGVAVLLLKKLSDAESAGDRIYGVIKAIATNHGGKATGYTVPNPMAHKDVVQTALKRANVEPQEVSYIECHGTGTDLGDPIEIAGLRHAFENSTDNKQFCGIGTIKSNIGHCEATAGIAGLVKVLLSMKAKMIPATLHAEIPNQKIDFNHTPFYLVRKNTPWQPHNGRFVAGLSSFGAGGSNCHCILESYARSDNKCVHINAQIPEIIAISSLNIQRSRAFCNRLNEFLSEKEDVILSDVAYTLTQRETFQHRQAFIAETKQELINLLESYTQSTSESSILISSTLENDSSTIRSLREKALDWINNKLPLQELPMSEQANFISLPTYAFEPKHSWVSQSPFLYQKQFHVDSNIHPLLDKNLSTAKEGRFLKTLYRREYYVDEHWIQGAPVLPGVCLIEMALSAAKRYLDTDNLSLSDIWFLQPINLKDRDSVDLEVKISVADDAYRFEVHSDHGGVKHVTGKVSSVNKNYKKTALINIEKIQSGCHEHLTTEQVYQGFGKIEIEQKGRFKVISDLHLNDNEAIAKLILRENAIGQNDYGMNPSLLDGAVQTAMVHLFHQINTDSTFLPFQVGTCIRYRPLTSKVTVVANLISLDAKKYHINMYDESGNLLVSFSDFVFKNYQEKNLKPAPMVFSPYFEDLPQIKNFPIPATDSEANVCILSTLTGLISAMEIPQQWEKIILDTNVSPNNELLSWLERSQSISPCIAIMLDDIQETTDKKLIYQSLQDYAARLFDISKILLSANRAAEIIICVVGKSAVSKALAQSCLSFSRSLNKEMLKSRCRVVEVLDHKPENLLIDILLSELSNAHAEIYVRYLNQKRLKLQYRPFAESKKIKRNTSPAWIVTGANGGLGRIIVKHLLSNEQKVVMLGRSPQDKDNQKSLESFPTDKWTYIQCDLTDKNQVLGAIEKSTALFGEHWGIIHCAGIIKDALLINKDWYDFKNVLSAKTETLLNLCVLLPEASVERLVLFSSLTSSMGNQGQTDYAYANGFIDGFADIAREIVGNELIVRVMNWPYWKEGGMRISEDKLPAYMDAFMTQPLPTSFGLDLIDDMLQGESANTGVIFSTHKISELNARLKLKPFPSSQYTPDEITSAAKSVSEIPINKNDETKKHEIKRFVLDFLERHIQLGLDENDLHTEFSELGMDSITQMDLITQLEKENRFENVPQTLLSENPTIAALTDFFIENHWDADYQMS